jgi:hypothetical protein
MLFLHEKIYWASSVRDTLTSMNDLAGVLWRQGKYETAEEIGPAGAEAEGEDAGLRAPGHADEHEQPGGGAS